MLPVIHVMVMVLNQAQVKHVAIVMVQDMYLLNKIQDALSKLVLSVRVVVKNLKNHVQLVMVKGLKIKVKLEVTVPEGVDNEQQIRLAGEGAPGENGGPHGDLYVVFRVKPSDKFRREMAMIYSMNLTLASHKHHLAMKSKYQL